MDDHASSGSRWSKRLAREDQRRRELAERERQHDEDSKVLEQHPRPRTRADCRDQPRPCPWVGCRHHLALDFTKTGEIRVNGRVERNPDPDLEGMEQTCALDVVDANPAGLNLAEVAKLLDVSRQRVQQIEIRGVAALARSPRLRVVSE